LGVSYNPGVIVLTTFSRSNATYFMALFFFYSGFFVPKSFDKKGSKVFLLERVKRLGIPVVVYSFLIGPYLQNGLYYLLFDIATNGNHSSFPIKLLSSGVTWFLTQLIVLGIMYAIVCKNDWYPKMKCPTLIGFFWISLFIGIIAGTITLFLPNGTEYFSVPNFFYDYIQDIFFFFGGAIAQRNNWMDELKNNRSRIGIYLWLVISFILYFAASFTEGMYSPIALHFVLAIIEKGIYAMGISLSLSVFFMDYVNKQYWCTKFFAVSMYTAYILQYIPDLLSLRCWIWLLETTGNIELITAEDGSSDWKYKNDNLVLPGFLFVSAFTMIMLWPLAYGIRSIPGFSNIL